MKGGDPPLVSSEQFVEDPYSYLLGGILPMEGNVIDGKALIKLEDLERLRNLIEELQALKKPPVT